MRLHRNLCLAVIDGILLIFNENEYADKVIQNLLKRNKTWGSRDRGFIAETTYDIVRWKRLYSKIAEVKSPFSRDDAWRLLAVWIVLKGIKLPDWKYFENTPNRKIKGRFDTLIKERVFRESIPDWIDKIGVKELGLKKWEKELSALNKQAQVVLRTNTLKIDKELLQSKLEDEGVLTTINKNYSDALILDERKNVFRTEAFKNGWFHTGDLGVLHSDGYLQLKDRAKDIIISGGENISSIEIEDCLYLHDAIASCGVVAKPDDKWGEVPCAFIEMVKDKPTTEKELISFCKETLAGFKVPKQVVFCELPKTSTGKIQKFELRKKF